MCRPGVGQQRETASTLQRRWAPALCGGAQLAGGQLAQDEVYYAAYGDLFRPPGRPLAVGDPLIRAEDLDGFERELLAQWWTESARTDPTVIVRTSGPWRGHHAVCRPRCER